MQVNITFKTIFEFILTKVVLCIQIRFVSTEKTTRIASRASCFYCAVLCTVNRLHIQSLCYEGHRPSTVVAIRIELRMFYQDIASTSF